MFLMATEKTNPDLAQYHVVRAEPAGTPEHPNDWNVVDTRTGEVIAEKYEPVEPRPEGVECPYCWDGEELVDVIGDVEIRETCQHCDGDFGAVYNARSCAESLAAEINAAFPNVYGPNDPAVEDLWDKAKELRITGVV
jgi:hypothetical protein